MLCYPDKYLEKNADRFSVASILPEFYFIN